MAGSAKYFFSLSTIQPKLTIGQPNDKYEQEADAMAEKVNRMPMDNGIQTKCDTCGGEEENRASVQTKIRQKLLSNHNEVGIQRKLKVGSKRFSTLSKLKKGLIHYWGNRKTGRLFRRYRSIIKKLINDPVKVHAFKNYSALIRYLRRKLIKKFKINPTTINVRHEMTKISFVLTRQAKDINWYVSGFLKSRGRTAVTEFRTNNKGPGYKYAFWNGKLKIFSGGPGPAINTAPPESGKYYVSLSVTSLRGRRETIIKPITVKNPNKQKTLNTRRQAHSLLFNGKTLGLFTVYGKHPVILISAKAISGKRRYQHPRYQWYKNRGPIPAGRYKISGGSVLHPIATRRGKLRYASGASLRGWGDVRIELTPRRRNRKGFFIHLDEGRPGTAGCIGVHRRDRGSFNHMVSIISRTQGAIPVVVDYNAKFSQYLLTGHQGWALP